MGGAQPLAVTMAGGVAICIEVDSRRISRRLETRYLDRSTDNLKEARAWAQSAINDRRPLSIGLLGNAADIVPEFAQKGIIPDLVTDQTSAHDELDGYIPNGMTMDAALDLRKSDAGTYVKESIRAMGEHVQAILDLKAVGAIAFDYGNNIRAQAMKAGVKNAFDIPGFVPKYIRQLFCDGKGPFRWVALSGDPEDIYRTDELVLEMFPRDDGLYNWIKMAREKVKFQGLPSRICWLGYGDRARFGLALNQLVADG
ncbi:uncharacterized protein METZ01_LOCUS451628, partial [marine metagenome]